MVDLITYLQQAVKNKSKKTEKPTKKKKKLPRVARRGLGFGMRHRNYKNYKDNKKDDTDSKLITLLTALFKSINPQNTLQQDKALNPFIEKEKQTYSMTFEPKVKTLEDRLNQVEQKQLTMGEENIKTKNLLAIESNKTIESNKAIDDKLEQLEQKQIKKPDIELIERKKKDINNKLADYETKWIDILENQESLLQEMNDIDVGDMNSHIQDRFREENQENKQDLLGLQIELQTELNEKDVDLNDYKPIIDFQNKVLTDGVDNLVLVDNRISQELKESKMGFEELQQITEDERMKLQVKLEKSEEKLEELTEDLNDVSNAYKKTKDKLQEYELSNIQPPRLEIKGVDEEDDEEEKFKPPSPRPKSPVERKLTPEETWFVNYIKGAGAMSGKRYKDIGKLFGEDKIKFFDTKGGGADVKKKRLKQLLIASGIDESVFKKTL